MPHVSKSLNQKQQTNFNSNIKERARDQVNGDFAGEENLESSEHDHSSNLKSRSIDKSKAKTPVR